MQRVSLQLSQESCTLTAFTASLLRISLRACTMVIIRKDVRSAASIFLCRVQESKDTVPTVLHLKG